MEQKSIINITNNELALIVDPIYPITKQNVIKKLKEILGQTAQLIIDNEELTILAPQKNYKISVGENYLGLPYIVIDIPKLTTDHPHFNARLMFWWGKYFSFQYFIDTKLFNCNKLLANIQRLEGFYILLTNNLWNNNITDADWRECVNLKDDDYFKIQQLDTIKICALHPIESYEYLTEAATNFYNTIKQNL